MIGLNPMKADRDTSVLVNVIYPVKMIAQAETLKYSTYLIIAHAISSGLY
jgi:hypothetical protein